MPKAIAGNGVRTIIVETASRFARDLMVQEVRFAKLRELSLTYNLTGRIPAMAGFSSMDLRVAGRNLHTWTKYKGLDPEANLGGAEFLTQGLDYFNSPQVRSFVISVGFNR